MLRRRDLPVVRAVIAALLAAADARRRPSPRPRPAAPYTPPGGHIFEGVSDMGSKKDYFRFTKAVKRHVPVMQSFEVWGGNLNEAKQR